MNKQNRFSIASGLNYRFVLRLLVIFISLDLLLFIMADTAMLYYAEKVGADVYDRVKEDGAPSEALNDWIGITGYEISQTDTAPRGLAVPKKLAGLFREGTAAASRSLLREDGSAGNPLDELENMYYRYEFTIDGETWSLRIDFGHVAPLFGRVMIFLLAIQLVVLVKTIFSGTGQIRRRLRPIEELAEAAQNLNTANTQGTVVDLTEMESFADKLDGINAAKLDTRISLDSTQDELKDLAEAINGMLARINDSYRSQVRFVSDASHELRTPISVIQGYANLLERWGKNDEKTLQESIRAIRDEASSMKSLVEQLLFLARGDNNTMTLSLEAFDPGDLVREVIKESELIEGGNIYEENTSPVTVYADRGLIKQALRILNDNAAKYSNPGGRIRIAVAQEEGFARLSVQDEGIGIPPESVPLIFERFYRADQSRARATGGTGLGLSIAKWIAERHGGHMEVLSREDLGTRVSILIPTAGTAALPETNAPAETA